MYIKRTHVGYQKDTDSDPKEGFYKIHECYDAGPTLNKKAKYFLETPEGWMRHIEHTSFAMRLIKDTEANT